MFDLGKIIGLSVIAIKASPGRDRRITSLKPEYILFSDGKTYIELNTIDPYDYHDAPCQARYIRLIEATPKVWAILLTYPDANSDI